MSVRDIALGARNAGTEAYIKDMSRLRYSEQIRIVSVRSDTARHSNLAIRPHRQLISVSSGVDCVYLQAHCQSDRKAAAQKEGYYSNGTKASGKKYYVKDRAEAFGGFLHFVG